jgi:penicillin amidase
MRTSRRAVRALRFGCAALLALALILAGGAWWLFVRPEAQYAGRVVLPGLSAPVQVVRDEYGIPHVFARTLTDAARVLGYLHASERLFQMEMQRRAGEGRLAEVVGAAGLPTDRWVRTLGLYDLARSSVAALSAETRELLDAYAQGVNGWLAANKGRLPPEFSLLRFSPEPWQSADSVVWGKLMALQLSANFHLEVLRAQLARAVTPPMAQRIFPRQPAAGTRHGRAARRGGRCAGRTVAHPE